MAESEADRSDIDEGQKVFGGLIVTGSNATSVLQLVKAPLDEVGRRSWLRSTAMRCLRLLRMGMTDATLRGSMVL